MTDKLTTASRGGSEIKTLEEFTALCERECKTGIANLVEEFTGRKEQLLRIKDMQVNEYRFMSSIISLNTQMNEGKVSPAAIMQLQADMDAIDYDSAMKSLTIRQWRKIHGDNMILPLISDILNYFLRQFTVKEKLTGNQIMQLAARLISSQPDLRVKELVLILNNALNGTYGPTYQRLGIESVMEWMTKYYDAASQALESKQVNNTQQESRGSQPWLEMERKLEAYKKEQMAKKEISDKIWKAEKHARNVQEFKDKVMSHGQSETTPDK